MLILWFLCIEVFGFVFGLCICVGCACCDLFDSDLWFIAGVCVCIECWSLSGWFFWLTFWYGCCGLDDSGLGLGCLRVCLVC